MITRTFEKVTVTETSGEKHEFYRPKAVQQMREEGIEGTIEFSSETRTMTIDTFVANSKVKGEK